MANNQKENYELETKTFHWQKVRLRNKDRINNERVLDKIDYMEEIEDYIKTLANEKLKVKTIQESRIIEEFEHSPYPKKLRREMSLKKKMTLDHKNLITTVEIEQILPDDILAKMRNDHEFGDIPLEDITPEVYKDFLLKQIYTNYILTKEAKALEEVQNAKKNKLAQLHKKLTELKCGKQCDTEDSTPKCFESVNLKDPQLNKLEKLKSLYIERRQLIAESISFTSRISYQLNSYDYNWLTQQNKSRIWLNNSV